MKIEHATKDIYKITNLVNGKIYIGQTKDCKRRFREHCTVRYNSSCNSAIRSAIQKYGEDNFIFEILEANVANYNEREKYWISYYQSDNREYGYNLTQGGEEPPIIKGDDSYFAKYSEELINKVKHDLILTELSFEELGKKYGLSVEYLTVLNRGILRHDENLQYPLRKHSNAILPKEKVLKVIDLLENSFLTYAEISKQCDISSRCIDDINNGRQRHCPEDLKYPIRKKHTKASQKSFDKLVNLLQSDKYKVDEIAKMLNISRVFISRFNNGKIYKQKDIEYPIRKSSQRVY